MTALTEQHLEQREQEQQQQRHLGTSSSLPALRGSLHRHTNGIGYGKYYPIEKCYASLRSMRQEEVRPSTSALSTYRQCNSLAGVDTHRTNISYGRPATRAYSGPGAERAVAARAQNLTSGEVGSFYSWNAALAGSCWGTGTQQQPPQRQRSQQVVAAATAAAARGPESEGTHEGAVVVLHKGAESGRSSARSDLTTSARLAGGHRAPASGGRCCTAAAPAAAEPWLSGRAHTRLRAAEAPLTSPPKLALAPKTGERARPAAAAFRAEFSHTFARHQLRDLAAAARAASSARRDGGGSGGRVPVTDARSVKSANGYVTEMITPWTHNLRGIRY